MRTRAGIVACACAALLLAGCGAAAAAPTQRVTLLTGGPLNGSYAPFYAASALGYDKTAGVSVDVVEGQTSLSTIQQVAAGHYTFGFVDVGATVAAITRGVPIKVVGTYFQKSPLAVVYRQSDPIATPAALVGKKVASEPGSATSQLFGGLLAANHIPAADVRVENLAISAQTGALAAGKIDGMLTFGFYALPLLAAHGIPAGQLLFSDAGVPLLGSGIVVADTYLKAHPASVRGFLQATAQGWAYAAAHPHQAVADLKAAAPANLTTQIGPAWVQQLVLALQLLHTPASRGHPAGWMAPGDWSATLSTLVHDEGLKSPLPPSAYYTDAELPTGSN